MIPVFNLGDRVLVVQGIYRGNVGTIVEVHEGWRNVENCYSIVLDVPIAMEIAGVPFNNHRSFLSSGSKLRLVTEMGEAIYGELDSDSEKTL